MRVAACRRLKSKIAFSRACSDRRSCTHRPRAMASERAPTTRASRGGRTRFNDGGLVSGSELRHRAGNVGRHVLFEDTADGTVRAHRVDQLAPGLLLLG